MAQDAGPVSFKVKSRGEQLVLQVRADGVNFEELQQFAGATPPGFLRVEEAKADRISYTGPAGVPLSEWIQQPVTRYEFFYVTAQLADAVMGVRRNDLYLRNLLLNPNQIYINRNTRELGFVYLPLFTNQAPPDMRGLMAAIAGAVGQEDYAVRFLSFVQGIELCDADAVMAYVAREEPELVRRLEARAGVACSVQDLSKTQFQSVPVPDSPNIVNVPGIENVSGTAEAQAQPTLEPAESTEPIAPAVLEPEPKPMNFGTLLRVSTGETIHILTPSFRLGREQSTVSYIVEGNSAVSRNHADILSKGQSHFIVDLDSRNRTFLNGQPIPPHLEVELRDGDQVRLGNEDFIFRV